MGDRVTEDKARLLANKAIDVARVACHAAGRNPERALVEVIQTGVIGEATTHLLAGEVLALGDALLGRLTVTERLRSLLRQVQWQSDGHSAEFWCACCGNAKRDGCDPECQLSALAPSPTTNVQRETDTESDTPAPPAA